MFSHGYGLLTALAWSLANVSIHRAGQRIGPPAAMVGSMGVGVVALMIVSFLSGTAPRFSAEAVLWLAVSGIAAAFAYGGLFHALTRGPVAVVAPIISSWSIVSSILAVLFLGEHWTRWVIGGSLAVVVGNALLASAPREGSSDAHADGRTWIASLVSATGFGVMAPAMQAMGRTLGPAWTPPLVWLSAALFAAPWLLRLRGPRATYSASAGLLLILPGLLEAAGLFCLNRGLEQDALTVLAPLASLATGLTVLWGYLFLGERLRPRAAWGAILASAGVVLLNLK
jgi:transporter family protein